MLINRSSVRSLYIKGGGLKQAKEDFKAFNPTNIKYDVVRCYSSINWFSDNLNAKMLLI